jgi:hypothetical protein
LVGAGGAEGAVDAANMLKPALARGELHCVGATTVDEYRKHIEKDAALERRFLPVLVGEPSVEDTIAILRGLKERYELHHGVRILDEALVAAARLAGRHIPTGSCPTRRSIASTRRPPAPDGDRLAAARARLGRAADPAARDREDRARAESGADTKKRLGVIATDLGEPEGAGQRPARALAGGEGPDHLDPRGQDAHRGPQGGVRAQGARGRLRRVARSATASCPKRRRPRGRQRRSSRGARRRARCSPRPVDAR